MSFQNNENRITVFSKHQPYYLHLKLRRPRKLAVLINLLRITWFNVRNSLDSQMFKLFKNQMIKIPGSWMEDMLHKRHWNHIKPVTQYSHLTSYYIQINTFMKDVSSWTQSSPRFTCWRYHKYCTFKQLKYTHLSSHCSYILHEKYKKKSLSSFLFLLEGTKINILYSIKLLKHFVIYSPPEQGMFTKDKRWQIISISVKEAIGQ